jgi:hypothetical protein
MEEIVIVAKAAGIALIIIVALHIIVRVGSVAYFKSKREYIRRISNEG